MNATPDQYFRQLLAERLRWLAAQWRAATPQRKAEIEFAFRRGEESGDA